MVASGLHSGFRARGGRGKRARQGIGPTAGADAGVSRAVGRRELRSARCRDAPRGKKQGSAAGVRRKGKLTGGARLSVAHGGERAWGKGVAGRAKQAGWASRASARVGACDRAAAAGFGLVGVERWVGPARLGGSRPGLVSRFRLAFCI